MPIVRCRIVVNEVGVKQYIPFALEDDVKAVLINDSVVIFNVFPKGDKIDVRNKPPFHSIIPCPHCGTDNDRKHDHTKHVESKLGTSENDVVALAKDIANEYGSPDRWWELTVLAANELLNKQNNVINPRTRTERVREIFDKPPTTLLRAYRPKNISAKEPAPAKEPPPKRLPTPLLGEIKVQTLAKEIAKEYNIENCNGDLTVLAAEEFLDKQLGRTNPKTRTDRIKEIMSKRSGGLKGWDPRVTQGGIDYYGKSIKQIAAEVADRRFGAKTVPSP